MIPHGLEDALDRILERGSPTTSVEAALLQLPPDLRRQVERDPEARNWLAEQIALHAAVRRLGSPLPSAGFADRVVAASRIQRAPSRFVQVGWGVGLALAACLVIVVVQMRRAEMAQNPAPTPVDPDPVSATGVAFSLPTTPTDIFQSLSFTAPRAGSGSVRQASAGQMSAELPPFGPRLRSSTETLLAAAGRQLGDRVKPVASSVGGAFGFVFEIPAVEKRSL